MKSTQQKHCAYCGGNSKLTKEHIIPNWYCKTSSHNEFFFEKSPKKIINGDLVIKDVCQTCNSHHLSILDSYGEGLFQEFFRHIVDSESVPVSFNYKYQLLVRWLLKISFNSARAHSTDLEILNEYPDIILGQATIPKNFKLFCSFISKSNEDSAFEEATDEQQIMDDNELLYPEWFRVGVFRVPGFQNIKSQWVFRHVIINSFIFFLFIPVPNKNLCRNERKDLNKSIKSNLKIFGTELTDLGHTSLGVIYTDAQSSLLNHFFSNPVTYEIDQEPFAQAVQSGQFGIIHYIIPREDIESGNMSELETFLENACLTRETALSYMQKIEFSIHGYDNDSRELWEIPEVRSYLKLLNEKFPYWMFFQHPDGKWILVLLHILSIENRKDLDSDLIDSWYIALNQLSDKLFISLALNKKISTDFQGMLMKNLVPSN